MLRHGQLGNRHPQLLQKVDQMAGELLSPKQPDHEGGKMINAILDAPVAFKHELVGEVRPVH